MDNKKEWGGGFFKITKSISDFIFLNIKKKTGTNNFKYYIVFYFNLIVNYSFPN